jgi:hypothetical protein
MFTERFTKHSFIEDDFVDQKFNSEAIYEFLNERYKEDPCIKILSYSESRKDLSRIAVHDFDSRTVAVGGAKCKEPDYHIEPDYTPVEIVKENFDRFNRGSMVPFEYIPVAHPRIPSNKYYNADSEKHVELAFATMGYKILNPTPGQVARIPDLAQYASDISPDMVGVHLDRYCLSIDDPTVLSSKAIVIGMQFNPFHPYAAALIRNFKWQTDMKAVGDWEYRNKFHTFEFNLLDKHYRVHSDQWLRAISAITEDAKDYFSCFDLICHKDFLVKLSFIMTRSVVEPLVVEPLFTTRDPPLGYSVIGPWEGDLRRGHSDFFYAPYLTPRLAASKFINKYKLCPSIANEHDVVVYPDDKNMLVKLERNRNSVHSDRFYLKANPQSVDIFEVDCNGEYIFEEADCKILNFPSNYYYDQNTGKRMYRTLVYGFRCVDIMTSIADRRRTVMDRAMSSHIWGKPVWDFDIMLTAFGDEAFRFDVPPSISSGSMTIRPRPGTAQHNIAGPKVKPRKFKDKDDNAKLVSALTNYHSGSNYKKPHVVLPTAKIKKNQLVPSKVKKKM